MRIIQNPFFRLFALLALASAAHSQRTMERLDRGLVAVRSGSGYFLSWRLFGNEGADVAFNVYRGGTKLNAAPIADATSFSDPEAPAGSAYAVRAVMGGKEQAAEGKALVLSAPYLTIPLQRPAGGTTPDGAAYTYSPSDLSVGDLDGDGAYEIIVKWDPSDSKDNSQAGYTGNVFLDAYKLDGTRLWRIDLGRNIRAGAHYTQFLVYDFDGDGRAETICKTAPGTRDASGNYLSLGPAAAATHSADYRNSDGYVLQGPEYLTAFGPDGKEKATVDYLPARGTVSHWGDSYGNRVDRFLAGVAYLDGKRPSALLCRGYYNGQSGGGPGRTFIWAVDFRDGKLTQRWTFDTDASGSAFIHQGAHSLTIGDVDGDGRDDLVYGAMAIGSDGKSLYNTKLCHGDALHMSDMLPSRPGLEVWMVHEDPGCYGSTGLEFRDARTGQLIFGVDGEDADVGRGVAGDIDPRYPGYEMWGSRGGLMSANGTRISATHPGPVNFMAWWDGDLLRELLDAETISKWDYAAGKATALLSAGASGAASNNGTKATPGLSADILGDWREEVIWRHSDNTKLLVFTTTIATKYRFPTLMHDPKYRLDVAWQNVGYNQPPHPGFFLGDGMAYPPPLPDIAIAGGTTSLPRAQAARPRGRGGRGTELFDLSGRRADPKGKRGLYLSRDAAGGRILVPSL